MGKLFAQRDAQTRIKHGILREYAGAWEGIIGRGHFRLPADRRPNVIDFVYLDGFGGEGRYQRDADQPPADEPIWGSPILAMQALENEAEILRQKGLNPRLTGIIVEEHKNFYEKLASNLRAAGLRTPIEETDRFSPDGFGRVSLLRGDFRAHLDPVLQTLGPSPYVLALVDPWGPTMSLEQLSRLVGRRRTDSIVLFPVNDVIRKAGSARKFYDDVARTDEINVKMITAHFGTEAWLEIATCFGLSTQEQEDRYSALYLERLRQLDDELIVKTIPLRFATMNRVVHNFFLTTRDPHGALRMNEILRKAGFREHWERWSDQEARARSHTQEDLFDGLGLPRINPPTADEPGSVDLDQVCDDILSLCPRGRDLTRKSLYAHMAETIYSASEIDRALRKLKKKGDANFDKLDNARDIIRLAT